MHRGATDWLPALFCLIFYFEVIIDSQEVAKIVQKDLCMLHLGPRGSDILHDYMMTSNPGNCH